MSIFSRLFKKKNNIKDDELPDIDFTPFLGGDGKNVDEPVIIDCSSQAMAVSLIERFISENHGIKDVDWYQEMSMTVSSEKTKCGIVKSISIVSNEQSYCYYFDLSRPMKSSFLKKIFVLKDTANSQLEVLQSNCRNFKLYHLDTSNFCY